MRFARPPTAALTHFSFLFPNVFPRYVSSSIVAIPNSGCAYTRYVRVRSRGECDRVAMFPHLPEWSSSFR